MLQQRWLGLGRFDHYAILGVSCPHYNACFHLRLYSCHYQGLNIIRAAAMQKSVDAYQVVELTNLPESVPAASFWAVFVDSWAFFSIGIPKLGIAFLTCRILRPPRWLQTSVISFCIVLNVLATVGFILCFVQCSPVAGQFNPWKYPHVKCWDRRVQLDYACAVSCMFEFQSFNSV